MKAKDIQELIDFIAKSGLDEVNVETDSFKISVKRSNAVLSQTAAPVISNIASTPVANTVTATETTMIQPEVKSESVAAATDDSKLITITSPMIGTFYRSANPESDSFVNVGDSIKEGDVVCIIEAMKLFNEIEAEVSGKIVKVLVDNATPVEYDQPLFLVDPS